jgi:hypothetical protein
MVELLKDTIPKVLGYIMPFVVRWFYKAGKINEGIKVRVNSDGDGVTYNCGELPTVRIWLQLSNLTPFTIEFDRIYGQLCYGGVLGEFTHIKKYRLLPASEQDALIVISLTEAQVQYIRRNLSNVQASKIYLAAFINCKIHSFELHREVNTNNVKLYNCDKAVS